MKLTKKEIKEIRISQMKEELKLMLEKNNHTVITENLHTSRSGMMRSLRLTLQDGTNITDLVAEIGDYKYHTNKRNQVGLKVTGCGMDMGFSVVYDLSCKLYCTEKYEHDNAYKLNQRWL